MSPPQFRPSDSSVLKDKVVVLTGGALGIGAATVRKLHSVGAHVFFGDVVDEVGQALEEELSDHDTIVKFIHCDVSLYKDNLRLFQRAFDAFQRVDHAWANAALGEQGNIFDPELTLETVKYEPIRSVGLLDVNLKGPIYFARIASVYLRQGDITGDKSLTFTSSVGGFREDPGLWVYVPTKYGVVGLMRVLRSTLIKSKPSIRTNIICPWATRTRIFEGVKESWQATGLPVNAPEDVAKVVVGVLSDARLNGMTMYIEGGRCWNVEEGLRQTRPQWLGERQTEDLDRGTQVLGGGEGWVKGQD